jgi:hypothetical protein
VESEISKPEEGVVEMPTDVSDPKTLSIDCVAYAKEVVNKKKKKTIPFVRIKNIYQKFKSLRNLNSVCNMSFENPLN